MNTNIDILKEKVKILLLEIAVDDKYFLQEVKEKSRQGVSIESGEIFKNFYDEKNTQSDLDIQEKIHEQFPGIVSEIYHSIIK